MTGSLFNILSHDGAFGSFVASKYIMCTPMSVSLFLDYYFDSMKLAIHVNKYTMIFMACFIDVMDRKLVNKELKTFQKHFNGEKHREYTQSLLLE